MQPHRQLERPARGAAGAEAVAHVVAHVVAAAVAAAAAAVMAWTPTVRRRRLASACG
jgi:hypothetical protein